MNEEFEKWFSEWGENYGSNYNELQAAYLAGAYMVTIKSATMIAQPANLVAIAEACNRANLTKTR